MLERFQSINKVGLFESYANSPECNFGKVTLIYGENGVGKSTLAAILDSLREANADEIIRRRSLPGTVEPTAVIGVNGKDYSFDGRNWGASLPHETLEVFYPSFVTRNVHGATGIDSNHRRNLCEFVIGRKAVENVERLENADNERRTALDAIKGIDRQLLQLIKEPDTIDTFVALSNDPKISEKIELIQTELRQAQSKDAICARDIPRIIVLPTIDHARIIKVLEKNMDGIGTDVAVVVQEHIAKHMDTDGEGWLSYGAKHLNNKCPFCAQDIKGSNLVTAIRSYFSTEYQTHLESLLREIEALRDEFGFTAYMQIQMDLMAQITKTTQWMDQVAFDQSANVVKLAEAEAIWRSAVEKLEVILKTKQSKPLDGLDGTLAAGALADYDRALVLLHEVNSNIGIIIKLIEEQKARLAKADTIVIERRSRCLENQKIRFEPCAQSLLDHRQKLNKQRNKLEEEKIKLKKEIDELANKVVGKYQIGINYYLKYFGCDIRIEAIEPKFPSGRASVQYVLKAHGYEIDLGVASDKPCFETVLSDGDKVTLALAFFLARLKDHENLEERIIVLDDPVNSFGNSRRTLVGQIIRDLHVRGAQVIVLTHDERLAAMMWRDDKLKDKIVSLQVERTRSGSQLRSWDIESAIRSEYVKQYIILNDYLDRGGDHMKAAVSIRPYVEHRLRHMFPGPPFTTRDNLGAMIKKIRECDKKVRISELQKKLTDLESLNQASLPSHHGSDGVLDMTPLTPEGVRLFAEKALDI